MKKISKNSDSFTPFQEFVPHVLRHYGLDREVKGAVVCQQFRKISQHIWGDDVLENVRPLSYHNATLTVGVRHSGWAQKVHQQNEALLKILLKHCPAHPVKTIKTHVRKI